MIVTGFQGDMEFYQHMKADSNFHVFYCSALARNLYISNLEGPYIDSIMPPDSCICIGTWGS